MLKYEKKMKDTDTENCRKGKASLQPDYCESFKVFLSLCRCKNINRKFSLN